MTTFDQLLAGFEQLDSKLPADRAINIYFDGGCSPNPGHKYGSFEVVVFGQRICGRKRVSFGHGTNNEAEFNAMEMAIAETLEWFRHHDLDPKNHELLIFTDSTIVRNRMMVKNTIFKKYPETSGRMFCLAAQSLVLARQFGSFKVEWAPRDRNVERFGH